MSQQQQQKDPRKDANDPNRKDDRQDNNSGGQPGQQGAARNPNQVLAEIIASLRNPDGSVAVDGFYDGVEEVPADVRDGWKRSVSRSESCAGTALCMHANSTTCVATIFNCFSASGSLSRPSVPNGAPEVLMQPPAGVGHPRRTTAPTRGRRLDGSTGGAL